MEHKWAEKKMVGKKIKTGSWEENMTREDIIYKIKQEMTDHDICGSRSSSSRQIKTVA